jgi:hypothetical protein
MQRISRLQRASILLSASIVGKSSTLQGAPVPVIMDDEEEKQMRKYELEHHQSNYPHDLTFDMIKMVVLGAFAGGAWAIANRVFFRNSGILNKYISKLPGDVEGMEREVELCRTLHAINEKYASYNATAFASAYKHCLDLCFLAEEICRGCLNKMIPHIESGEIDIEEDVRMDRAALQLFFGVHNNLKDLYHRVNQSELAQFQERERMRQKYLRDKEQYELDKNKHKKLVNQAKNDEDDEDPFGMVYDSNKDTHQVKSSVKALPPPPVPPQVPPQLKWKLKSDEVRNLMVAVDNRTKQLYTYVKRSVVAFKKEYAKTSSKRNSLESNGSAGTPRRRPASTGKSL